MNPNGISHRLFVAALAQDVQTAGKRPAPVRADRSQSADKLQSGRSATPFSALAARPVAEWSWSGWQQTMI